MEWLRTIAITGAAQLVVLSSLAQGLRLEPGTILAELRRPVSWRALATIVLLLPLVAIAISRLLPVSTTAAVTLVLMACCPGQVMQTQTASRIGGNPRLSIALAVSLTLLSIITVPAWVKLLGKFSSVGWHASPRMVLTQLAPKMLAPLILGFALRVAVPRVAQALAPWCERFLYVALACAAALLVALGGQALVAARPVALLAALAVLGTSALLGAIAGGPDPRDRTTVGLAALFGNPAVALAVTEANPTGLPTAPAIGAYVLLRVAVTLAFARWARSRLTPLAA